LGLVGWGLVSLLVTSTAACQQSEATPALGQPVKITVDGSAYEVWYNQFPMDSHVSFSQSPKATPLEQWTDTVHAAAEKMALQSNH
jgi:hypothetical protein